MTRALQEEPRPAGPCSDLGSALTGRLRGLRLRAAIIKAPRRPGLLHQTMDGFVSFACLLATWGLCSLGGFNSFELSAVFVVSCYFCKTFSAAAPSSALSPCLPGQSWASRHRLGNPAVPTSRQPPLSWRVHGGVCWRSILGETAFPSTEQGLRQGFRCYPAWFSPDFLINSTLPPPTPQDSCFRRFPLRQLRPTPRAGEREPEGL